VTFAVVVTCEHASSRVPAELGDLGLPAAVLASHRGFDAGALPIARVLAKALRAPLHAGEWSRLVADLNRTAIHPHVVRRSVDGRRIAANALTAAARAERLAKYWAPYHDAVAARITRLAAQTQVLHVSVHSFVERLHGVERRNHIGLLHDPQRPREAALCRTLKASLIDAGMIVRLNFPYFGNTDGFAHWLRQRLPASRYLGLEVECNQRVVRHAAGQRRIAAALRDALAAVTGAR
jgi:predicted N-formylglutamate amidohydrolase